MNNAQGNRFDTMGNMRKLKEVWVDELKMAIISFQQAIEKMMAYKVEWVGGRPSGWLEFAKTMASLTQCSSEHNGEVFAFVFMGVSGRSGKVPFVCKGRLFLASYHQDYTIVVEDNYLNVKDLIFWIDTEKCDVADLGLGVCFGDFCELQLC